MADPRYRKGVFVGFDPNARRRAAVQAMALQDSPLFYGWEAIDRLDDGRRVWQLESNFRVTMHRMSQADKTRYDIDNEWLVYVGGKAFGGYSGELDAITAEIKADVKQLLEAAA